jgi:membrane protease YdiL (CAAX protease family)
VTSIPVAASAAPSLARSSTDVDQDSLGRSVAFHLLPGLAGLAALLISAPIFAALGWPMLFAFYGPMSATVVAFEGGLLIHERRRRAASGDSRRLVDLRGSLSLRRLTALAVGLFAGGIVLSGVLSLVDRVLVTGVFAGLPSWWLASDPTAVLDSPRGLLVVTFAVGLVMNGFVGPIVEESYFRGYLLPRLSRLGWRAPVLNAVLFSLYHFWQPWALVSRLGYVLPYVVAVHRTRSVGLGMAVHCAANLLGLLVLVSLVLR